MSLPSQMTMLRYRAASMRAARVFACVVVAVGIVAGVSAADDTVSVATRYRYAGMCQWASQKPPQWLLGYANRPDQWGKQPFDLVYDEWFHVLKRGANNLGRQGNFYQALCGLIMLEAEFDQGSAELLKQQVDYLEGVRLAVAQGENAYSLIAAAGEDPHLRALLGATDREISLAIAGESILTVFAHLKAAEADSKALMLAPVVSANHSIEIIEAIQASTGDGDITRACDGVLRELREGREDCISRLHNLAVNGQLSSLLASAAAKGSISLGVKALLSGLGMQATAGTIGTIAGTGFAAFVGGMEIGFWLTGETAAYEHARLAHFAAYMQPGLGERWLDLKRKVNTRAPDTCAEFDATTRALILLNGYINQETDYMAQCYATAVVKFGFWKRTKALPMDGYQRDYASWNSGELFDMRAKGNGRPEPAPGGQDGPVAERYRLAQAWYCDGMVPTAIAVGRDGTLYAADRSTSHILVFDGEGNHLASWDPLGDVGDPELLLADPTGDIWLFDLFDIAQLTGKGKLVRCYRGAGSNADDVQAYAIIAARTGRPFAWRLWGGLRVCTPNGEVLGPWPLSQSVESGLASGGLSIRAVRTDRDGHIYMLADEPSGEFMGEDHHVVVRLDRNGRLAAKWGMDGGREGRTWAPEALEVDERGYVYVSDSKNHCIVKFSSSGQVIAKWPALPPSNVDGSAQSGPSGVEGPYCLALGADGSVYAVVTGSRFYGPQRWMLQRFSPEAP